MVTPGVHHLPGRQGELGERSRAPVDGVRDVAEERISAGGLGHPHPHGGDQRFRSFTEFLNGESDQSLQRKCQQEFNIRKIKPPIQLTVNALLHLASADWL